MTCTAEYQERNTLNNDLFGLTTFLTAQHEEMMLILRININFHQQDSHGESRG